MIPPPLEYGHDEIGGVLFLFFSGLKVGEGSVNVPPIHPHSCCSACLVHHWLTKDSIIPLRREDQKNPLCTFMRLLFQSWALFLVVHLENQWDEIFDPARNCLLSCPP